MDVEARLLKAVREGDATKLQKLVSQNQGIIERISCLNERSNTVLHVAVLAKQVESIKFLLRKRADLATRLDEDGFSPIHIAATNGFVTIVIELLKVNSELARLKSSNGRTALHFAAIIGNVPIIEQLFKYCPSCKDDLTRRGETALHLAVKYNQFEAFKAMVDMLKQYNMEELLNAKDEDGNTLLHLATAKGQPPTLKLLLGGEDIKRGIVEVNGMNKSGLTALDVLDVVQQMATSHADYMLVEMFHRAGALRAKEVAETSVNVVTTHHNHTSINPVTKSSPPKDMNLSEFFLNEIKLLNPLTYYRKLAREVKESSSRTQEALLVVSVLIATVTYQAILSPPNGLYSDDYESSANIAGDLMEFILFMVPNSIGFFASLTIIIFLIQEFPLSALLGLAVRCIAASYVCGFLLIGPTSIYASHLGLLIIGIIVGVDLIRFTIWLFKRWTKEIRDHRQRAARRRLGA